MRTFASSAKPDKIRKRLPEELPLDSDRRDFLKAVGSGAVVLAMGGFLSPSLAWAAVPASRGYLLADLRKCAGCLNCMLACSLVHEGRVSLSLARIQVMQNSFSHVPDDLTTALCRQCVFPRCLEACPTGALRASPEHGNIRTVDGAKCIGCGACVTACPHVPGRIIWNAHSQRPTKCDLCASAPFWSHVGGPVGRQACVEICPQQALRVTAHIPWQQGDRGYLTPR